MKAVKTQFAHGFLNAMLGKQKTNGCYSIMALFQQSLRSLKRLRKGDGILVTSPVYPPFFQIPERQERNIVECIMIEKDGVYSIDFEEFREMPAAKCKTIHLM